MGDAAEGGDGRAVQVMVPIEAEVGGFSLSEFDGERDTCFDGEAVPAGREVEGKEGAATEVRGWGAIDIDRDPGAGWGFALGV